MLNNQIHTMHSVGEIRDYLEDKQESGVLITVSFGADRVYLIPEGDDESDVAYCVAELEPLRQFQSQGCLECATLLRALEA